MERKLRWSKQRTITDAWTCKQVGKPRCPHRAWISGLYGTYVGKVWVLGHPNTQNYDGYWDDVLECPRTNDTNKDERTLREMKKILKAMLYIGMDTGP